MSPALLETAKVLVFLLSLVFHVFGVLISRWLSIPQMLLAFQRGEKMHKRLLRTCPTFIRGFL